MSLSYPTIGIIGGMGPLAGAELFRKLILNVDARTDQEHPPVVLMSYPHRLPDRTAFLTGESDQSPAPAIANIVRSMDRMGVAVVGMPCNTAHAPEILDDVFREMRRHNCKIRFIHIVEETIRCIEDGFKGVERVGILSTIGTRQSGLYHRALSAAGYDLVELSEDIHDALAHRAVYDTVDGIKASAASSLKEARGWILDGVERLIELGAEAVVLACTELPLAVPDSHYRATPLIDPSVALARALIRETYPDKLRPRYAAGPSSG